MSRRMLIVDDEETIRWALRELFIQEAWVVHTAADGDQAARLLAENCYDFLITDLRMPGLPGMQVVQRARKMNPSVGVLVLTGFGSQHTAVEALRLRVWDYVTKPCSIAHLKQRVEDFYAERGGRPEDHAEQGADRLVLFAGGHGTTLLEAEPQAHEGGVAASLDSLRSAVEDLGLPEAARQRLLQACVEMLALLPENGGTILRAGVVDGQLMVAFRSTDTDSAARACMVDELSSRFGVAAQAIECDDGTAVVLSEGLR